MPALPRIALVVAMTLAAANTVPAQASHQESRTNLALEKRFELNLDPDTHQLEGSVTWQTETDQVRFRLHPRLVVTGARTETGGVAAVRESEERWRVDLPDDADSLSVTFSGCLREIDGNGRRPPFLRADGGLLSPDSAWYPQIEGHDTFAWRMDITMPAGQRAIASGELVDEHPDDDRIRARYHHPASRGITVATGPWSEARTVTEHGVLVRTLFPEELHDTHADVYLEHAARYLEHFEDEIGAYPLASFQVAATPLPVGLAFPGFTLLGEQVIPLPFIPRTSLAHEVLHAWWGNGIRVAPGSGNWAEGLTTFMADHRLAEERGEATTMRHRWLRDYNALPAAADRPLADFRGGNRGADRVVGYHRGAMLFLMLEDRIGADTFSDGASGLWHRHRYGSAGWEDLEAAFSAAANEDLALEDVAAREITDGRWEVRGTLRQRQSEGPFAVTVPLRVSGAGWSRDTSVDLEGGDTEFRLQVDGRPDHLRVDPEYRLWRQLPDQEAPAMVRAPLLDRHTRVVALSRDAASIARGMASTTLEEYDPEATPEGGLLVIGERQDTNRWLRRHGLQVPDNIQEHGGASAYALPGTRITVLAADSASGREGLARAVRHGGHDGFILQDRDGHTAARGDWPTGPSPLEHAFER